MFCGKCGTNNADNAIVCTRCGAPLKKKTIKIGSFEFDWDNKMHKIGAIVIAAVLVIGLMVLMFGGRSYKSVAKKYCKATFNADGKTMISLFPDEVVDAMIDDGDFDNKQELIEEIDEALQDTLDFVNEIAGGDYKVSYKIGNVSDASNRTLRDLKEDYDDEFDIKISAAKTIEIVLSVQIDGHKQSGSVVIGVVKIGRSWYVDTFTEPDIDFGLGF
ncbi:MAG: zinc ribbon domain-containing protein [Clostridia bacterium]|nr:zinc ribbon domain-containing protein [Clostridia bacterium]